MGRAYIHSYCNNPTHFNSINALFSMPNKYCINFFIDVFGNFIDDFESLSARIKFKFNEFISNI